MKSLYDTLVVAVHNLNTMTCQHLISIPDILSQCNTIVEEDINVIMGALTGEE